MIEKDFDVSFVAELALREKQIQQNYRPIISVHKWFARRPGTLFRSLLLAEFVEGVLKVNYFRPNKLSGIRVADPFMGGGTPLLEANRLGCDIIGYDINPMAHWIVSREIEYLDFIAYRRSAYSLRDSLLNNIGHLYQTRCHYCDSPNADVKYFLWVKTQACQRCYIPIDLFPGYLLAQDRRHPKNVFVCPACGDLNEAQDRENPGSCLSCSAPLHRSGPAKRGRCECANCGTINSYPDPKVGPLKHRMFAIEYHCPECKRRHSGRFFKKPENDDLAKYREAQEIWSKMNPAFVPDDEIPSGDETDRLHKWGYRYYKEMFNTRQLLGLELSCQAIERETDERIKKALATNLSDLLRYQNMLCRYDSMALKSLDIFSVHGFPVGLIQCESNLLGIANRSKGINVGSGGWSNIIEKYAKAKAYCQTPFEIRYENGRKIQIAISGEWIGDARRDKKLNEHRKVLLKCQSATLAEIPPGSLNAVVTDPPYFGNVQYAELMDFCYVWLRRLAGKNHDAFHVASTRNLNELTGNVTLERGLSHFAQGLSEVFCRMAIALNPGAPLIFTYHHNSLDAYYPIAVSILDAGLTCSASIPCPAEMGASIHINGTTSSILDTIFVCRSEGKVPRRWIVDCPEGIASLVLDNMKDLRAAKVKLTHGDIRCIIFGHLVRLAVWKLRQSWDWRKQLTERLDAVANCITELGNLQSIQEYLGQDLSLVSSHQRAMVREGEAVYESSDDEISF